MKMNKKTILAGALTLGTCSVMVLPSIVLAGNTPQISDFSTTFGGATFSELLQSLISVVMGLLGVVAVLLVLWGGFQWMVAGGEPDKVGKAKKIIYSGLIGLIIVFAAYAIANFVFQMIISKTGANVATS